MGIYFVAMAADHSVWLACWTLASAFGYSGGAVAALVVAQRNNVISLTTVAANLDIKELGPKKCGTNHKRD